MAPAVPRPLAQLGRLRAVRRPNRRLWQSSLLRCGADVHPSADARRDVGRRCPWSRLAHSSRLARPDRHTASGGQPAASVTARGAGSGASQHQTVECRYAAA